MDNEVNKELVKLVSENPDLPIKVFISGECQEDCSSWFVGEVYSCEVTEVASFDGTTYTKDDIDELAEEVYYYVCDDDNYKNLSNEQLEEVAKEKAKNLSWEKCILLKVEVSD